MCTETRAFSRKQKENCVHLSLSGMISDFPHDLHDLKQTEWEAKPINLVYQIQVTGKY